MAGNWIKDTSEMKVLGHSLESRLQDQDGYLTSANRFFVCNSGTTPVIDVQNYSILIHGNGVSRALTLSYEDLLGMPQRDVPAVLECAGNHRSLFQDVMGLKLDKRPQVTELMWSFGAVGMAEWRGVALRHVLERAGVKDHAYHICPKGSEIDSQEGEIKIPMPLSKAMDMDTIIALEMNGQPLPPDHGFPARMIVPGWVGAYSVKWLREIEVSCEHMWVTRNTEFYVLMGDEWPEEKFSPAKGAAVTERSMKSSLALPWPASLEPGVRAIHGYAHAPNVPIDSVHWSEDEGQTWQEATLTGPNEKYGWVRFQFEWLARKGRRVLMTRATDRNGNVQPEAVPFNTGGYSYNAIHPHPVDVEQ